MSKLSIFVLLLFVIGTECLQLPMYKKETYRQKVMRQGDWSEFRKINKAIIDHHMRIVDAAKNGQFASSSQPLYDYADQEYNIRISIGTPGQVFEVLPETSTANSWVVDKTCNGSYDECPLFCNVTQDYCEAHCEARCCKSGNFDASSPCLNKRKFDQDKSTTYVKDGTNFQLPFGLGNVTGVLGTDTVILGDSKSQVLIRDTTFGQAQRLAVEFGKLPLDGMLGLAFKAAGVDNVTPVFQHALDLKLFDEPVFTLWLASNGIDSVDKESGGLTFGSKDPKNCKDDGKFVNLVSEFIWWIKVNGVSASNKDKTQGHSDTQNAIISLGSSMLLMSYSDLSDIVKVSGANYDFDYGMFEVPCDAQFSWNVKIGSDELKVPSNNLIWKLDNGKCLLAVATWGDAPHPVDLVLGVPFLRSFCTIFDMGNGQLGFATKMN